MMTTMFGRALAIGLMVLPLTVAATTASAQDRPSKPATRTPATKGKRSPKPLPPRNTGKAADDAVMDKEKPEDVRWGDQDPDELAEQAEAEDAAERANEPDPADAWGDEEPAEVADPGPVGDAEPSDEPAEEPNDEPSPDRAPPAYGMAWRTMPVEPGPAVLDWEEGDAVPPGYVKSERVNRGLVIAGSITFGVSWLLSCAAATHQIEQKGGWDRAGEGDDAPGAAALYIPLAGPWIALRTMDTERGGKAALVADGIAQAAGLAMLIGGVAAKHTVLVRNKDATVAVAPQAGPDGAGTSLVGAF